MVPMLHCATQKFYSGGEEVEAGVRIEPTLAFINFCCVKRLETVAVLHCGGLEYLI
jgi:hypothetical protein